MAAVYCYREQCKFRSVRKSRANNRRGEPLYRCTKDIVVITENVDGDIIDFSKTNTCVCLGFEFKANLSE